MIAGGNTGNATALTTIVSVNPLYVYFDLDEKTFLNLKGQNKGYTDLMVDGAPLPHQPDTIIRWLIDRLRS